MNIYKNYITLQQSVGIMVRNIFHEGVKVCVMHIQHFIHSQTFVRKFHYVHSKKYFSPNTFSRNVVSIFTYILNLEHFNSA